MSIGDETAERPAPRRTIWAAPAALRGAVPGEPRPRSHNSGSGGPPVPPLPDRPARRDPAGRNAGTATPDAVPAWVTAGALPPPAPAVTPPTPAESGGNAAAGPAGHQTPAAPARRPWEDHGHSAQGGQGRLARDDGRCSGVEGALRPTSGRPAGGEDRESPAFRASPPAPCDPDRAITDWWDDEPDPRIPAAHIAGWFVLAAALWTLIILVGYDVWHLLRLGISWAT